MIVIVAHTENCAIVTEGTTVEREGRDEQTGYDQTTIQPTLCTCGGVNIRLEEDDPQRRGRYKVFTNGTDLFA